MAVTLNDPQPVLPPNDSQPGPQPVNEPDDTTPEARITELENEVTSLKKQLVDVYNYAKLANDQITQLLPLLNQLGNHRHDPANGTILIPLNALHSGNQPR